MYMHVLKYFDYGHLPDHLQAVSSKFHVLAHVLVNIVTHGPELEVALRKLLEAKDAAVRACIPETVQQAAERGRNA